MLPAPFLMVSLHIHRECLVRCHFKCFVSSYCLRAMMQHTTRKTNRLCFNILRSHNSLLIIAIFKIGRVEVLIKRTNTFLPFPREKPRIKSHVFDITEIRSVFLKVSNNGIYTTWQHAGIRTNNKNIIILFSRVPPF